MARLWLRLNLLTSSANFTISRNVGRHPLNRKRQMKYQDKIMYKKEIKLKIRELPEDLRREVLDIINCCIHLSSGQKDFHLNPYIRGQRGGAPLLNTSSLSNSNRRTLSLNLGHQLMVRSNY